jgi:hypothetical protein
LVILPNPVDHVTDWARQDGLYRANGTQGQRQLYVASNYAYLALPATPSVDDIHVFSLEKSRYYEETVEERCPVCESKIRQYPDDWTLLPCPDCGFHIEGYDSKLDFDTLTDDDIVACVRCKRPLVSGGVKFDDRVYCDACVNQFERIADSGVVVQSRHGKPDAGTHPYVVQYEGSDWVEDDQVAALARGKELAEANEVPGLFVYRRNGSHWTLDGYLDAHPSISSEIRSKRREIRGEDRVQIDTVDRVEAESASVGHDIRADGDVIIADNVIEDAVINRANIGTKGGYNDN